MALTWSLKDTEADIASPSYCYGFAYFLNRIYASCLYSTPYTIDQGSTWTQTNLRGVSDSIFNYYIIVHNDRLFVSGRNNPAAACVFMTDNGTTWTKKVLGNANFYIGTKFYEYNDKLFVGNFSNISYGSLTRYWYTSDTGDTWSYQEHPLRHCQAFAYNESNGKFYIVGQRNIAGLPMGAYYCTDPTSATWVPALTGLTTSTNHQLRDVKYFDGNLYACSSQGRVYKLNTISSWTQVFGGLTDCRGMEVFYNKLYVCGDSATVGASSVYSTDDGTTWTAEGITSYSTDVYSIWGNDVGYNIWAGTINSRAWRSNESVESIGDYSVIQKKALYSIVESNSLFSLEEIEHLYAPSEMNNLYSATESSQYNVIEIDNLHSTEALAEK